MAEATDFYAKQLAPFAANILADYAKLVKDEGTIVIAKDKRKAVAGRLHTILTQRFLEDLTGNAEMKIQDTFKNEAADMFANTLGVNEESFEKPLENGDIMAGIQLYQAAIQRRSSGRVTGEYRRLPKEQKDAIIHNIEGQAGIQFTADAKKSPAIGQAWYLAGMLGNEPKALAAQLRKMPGLVQKGEEETEEE
ncbi:MAG: hypothetical protein Q7R56_02660 [Nanoarchaeota archaeon]|nr:hypothetical protein [Nanoarchaeota archaeon]